MIGGGWRRGEERATDGESATSGHSKRRSGESVLSEELYQCAIYMAALSIQESILWIQAQENKMVKIGRRGDSADHKNLLELKSGMSELLQKLLRLAESETQRKVRAQQNACWLGNKGKAEKRIRSMDSQSKIAEDAEIEWVGKSSKRTSNESRPVNKQSKIRKSISNRLSEQELQAITELFKELPDNISMSIAASAKNIIEAEPLMEERALDFKLGLFSGHFHGLWDSMRQLASTEFKFLAICMFTCDESFVRCCSTLKSISAVIDRLCAWVPELTRVMRQIKKDEAILIRDVDVVMRQSKEDEDVLTRDGDVVMRQNKEDEDVLARDEDDEDKEEDVDVRTYEVEKMAEEYYFASYRRSWERMHGNGCNFEDPTLFGPMQFTHYMPGHTGRTIMDAKFLRTMQIYSIKVTETKGITLDWPLNVYGVVAARDVVDHRRNHLFLRTRDDCQILTKENPFLHLTGPSRAIMSGDTVMIEVQLQLKGTVQSEDAVLISKAFTCDDDNHGDSHLQGLCTIVLSCEHLKQSVQATILSVCAVQGSLPWGNGIVCSALSEDKAKVSVTCSPKHVLLLDSQAGTIPVDEEGYLELSRNVVSVKSTGELSVFIKAGEHIGSVVFTPQSSNVSQGRCKLGNCEVEITVAWSLLVESQHVIKPRGSIEPYGSKLSTCMPCMKLVEDACWNSRGDDGETTEGEMATAGNSRGSSGECVLSEELYQAAVSVYESIRWIQVQEDKMAEISAVRNNLLGLKSDIFKLFEKISRQSDSETQKRICAMQNAYLDVKSLETQSKIGDDGETETRCEESKRRSAASLELEDLLHCAAVQLQTQMWIGEDAESEELLDLAAKETQGRIVGQADNLSSLPKLTSEIMSKFGEVAGDIAMVFEAQQNRKEALTVLIFGFRLQLLSKQIDELWREMCKLLRAFSPENKDVMRTMIMFTREPYLRCICKLQWISEHISMLQGMDSDFDSKVKSMIIELKSESFLSAMEKLKEERRREGCGDQNVSMEMEEKRFAAYRLYWERTWGNTNSFEAQTLLSPMLFTHCTPRRIPIEAVAGSTLQIYSVKISLTDKISFPLEVYGVVAARDAVDRCRNPIFLRRRNFCQILTEQVAFLRLTGPVRAIVSTETVYMEIQLRVKGVTKSEDKALINAFYFYNGESSPQVAKNSFCTVELWNEQLKQSVQATILSVLVTAEAGSFPFPHGGRVVCSSLPQDVDEDIAELSSRQVVILDLEGGMAKTGYLDLSRHAVSVELNGQLKVLMEAYTPSQSVESTQALFITPQKWNVSKHKCNFGSYQVEITIAWSLIPSKTLS